MVEKISPQTWDQARSVRRPVLNPVYYKEQEFIE